MTAVTQRRRARADPLSVVVLCVCGHEPVAHTAHATSETDSACRWADGCDCQRWRIATRVSWPDF